MGKGTKRSRKKVVNQKVKKIQNMKFTKGGIKSKKSQFKTNMKKIAFDNSKKIDLLNEDITNVLMAPPKAAASGDIVKQSKAGLQEDADMPDVGELSDMMSAASGVGGEGQKDSQQDTAAAAGLSDDEDMADAAPDATVDKKKKKKKKGKSG